MIKFLKKKEKYFQYKGYSVVSPNKDKSIFSPICINETYINDNKTFDNNEDYPWPNVTGDPVVSVLQPSLQSQKRKVKMKSFSSPIVRDMHGNIKSILRHKPKNILHIGTKNAPTLPPNEILHEILELEIKIEEINKGCKFIILMQTYCFENWKAGNTVS